MRSVTTVSMYVFADSHPCEAVLAAALFKGVAVERRELPPVVHRLVMRARFGQWTVPGMIAGGAPVQGTSAIFERLDALVPAHPLLFPDDSPRGRAVREAERWGAGPFQDIARRLIWGHMRNSPVAMRAWADATPNLASRWIKRLMSRQVAAIASFGNGVTDERVRVDLASLPGHLDHVDALIAQGVIGTPEPTAADFQILSSIGLWMVLADVRPWVIDRPCGQAAAALFPRYLERPPIAAGVFPADWFAPLRETSSPRPN